MNPQPHFIGYDLRVRPETIAAWDDARRNLYLLRLDAPTPMSVDNAVWAPPEGYDFEKFSAVFGLSFVGLTERPSSSVAQRDVSIALSVYPERWSSAQKKQWNELVSDMNGAKRGLKELELRAVPPPSLDQYKLIGYDVADCGLISGLSNCGYSDDEPADSYRAEWADRLNGHHLFDDIDDAHAFVEFANRRMPEHAPFYVFGLWQAK